MSVLEEFCPYSVLTLGPFQQKMSPNQYVLILAEQNFPKRRKKVCKIPTHFFLVEKPQQQAIKPNCLWHFCFPVEAQIVGQSTTRWKMKSNRETCGSHFRNNLLNKMVDYAFLEQWQKYQNAVPM